MKYVEFSHKKTLFQQYEFYLCKFSFFFIYIIFSLKICLFEENFLFHMGIKEKTHKNRRFFEKLIK